MLKTVLVRELRDWSREGRVRWAFGIVATLLAVATVIGWQAYRQMAAERASAQTEDRRVWDTQGAVNPHSAAHFGRYVFKPTTPLSFVDRGVNSYLGVSTRLEAHTQTPSRHRPVDDAPAIARFGELTAAAVMQVLVPLVIVLLGFGTFAEEREHGTLRQVLSTGVSPRLLTLGKGLGMGVALLVFVAPLALLGSLALTSFGPAGETSVLLRFAVLLLAYLTYFAICIGVCLAVSARSATARTALVVLLACWMVNSLLVPRLASDVAARVAPVPSSDVFFERLRDDMRNGLDGHDPGDVRAEAFKQQVLAEYKVARVEDLPINFDGLALQESEAHANPVLDHHYGQLWRQYEQQAVLQRWLAPLGAPLLALRPVSMAMAGTDWEAHRAFTAQAESYRRVFVEHLNLHMARNSRYGDWDWKADDAFWRSVDEFRYSPPEVGATMMAQIPNFAILGGWALAAWTFVGWSLHRRALEN